jgi:hypothetical protein
MFIQYLRTNEEKITKKVISSIVGVTVQMLEYFPQAKAVMNDAVESYRASNLKGI